MILTGNAILSAVQQSKIIIRPFDEAFLGPNSYDFRLGNRCIVYEGEVLDAAKNNSTIHMSIGNDGIILEPTKVYLFNTIEVIGSDYFVPIIRSRSSFARLGLFTNITGDLIDLGSVGQLTLQLHAVVPLRVYPGMTIGHVTFWCTYGDRSLYCGKYKERERPTASLSYLDFDQTV